MNDEEFSDDERTSGVFMRVDSTRVLLITDPSFSDARIVEVIRACARGLPKGSFAVQLRDKVNPPARVLAFAAAMRAFTVALDVPLIMNGHVEVAAGIGMDGVHFGYDTVIPEHVASIPWISLSAHTDSDVARAIELDAKAALVSPVFDSGEKIGRGVQALTAARAIVRAKDSDLQIFALGGVDAESARSCFDAGAHGVAVIRALLAAPDLDAAVRSFDRALS